VMLRTPEVLQEVASERFRQERAVRQGEARISLSDPDCADSVRVMALAAALGEAADISNTLDRDWQDEVYLREALIVLAGRATAWAEALS
jgi:hypothetical protein